MANDWNDRMRDYIEVKDRIVAFYEKFPKGSLQSEVVTMTDKLVVIKGFAYRVPDDPRPGTGHSSLEIPGTTGFTKGSEIENAETSAWGRALAALGFEVKRSIASANEIRNKQAQCATEVPRPAPQPDRVADDADISWDNAPVESFQASTDARVTDAQAINVRQWCRSYGADFLAVFGESFGVATPEEMSEPQFKVWVDLRETKLKQWLQGRKGNKDVSGAEAMVNHTAGRIQSQNGALISDAQGKRLYAIAKGDRDILKQVLDQHGFSHSNQIPKARYEAICAEVEKAAKLE
jgi:hypothetical protein